MQRAKQQNRLQEVDVEDGLIQEEGLVVILGEEVVVHKGTLPEDKVKDNQVLKAVEVDHLQDNLGVHEVVRDHFLVVLNQSIDQEGIVEGDNLNNSNSIFLLE
jgi:hypothetical protein